ncbi:hypothetical protein CR513_35039, partial [Mucuna pruriens]
MPKIRRSTQITARVAALYYIILPVLQVRHGYHRRFPNSTRTNEMPDHGGGLFHKVDRSRTGCYHLDRKNQMFLVEENNSSVQSAIRNTLGQWDTICFPLFTSVEHPQSNGQAKTANKIILRGLRRRLEEVKGRWVKELSQVL